MSLGSLPFQRLVAAFRRHRTVLALGAVALAAVGWFGLQRLLGPQVAALAVVQREFVQSVVASGHVETPHRVSVGAQVIGTVRRVPVAEGQSVAAGTVLVELDGAEARAAAAQADAAVQQAQARLRQLREVQAPVAEQALRQAQISLDNARVQARRSAELLRQGFIGQAAMDDAQKAVDLAEAQRRSAEKGLESARTSGSDFAVAATALAQARAAAQAAHTRGRYMTIVAPVAGTLIARNVEPGDVVQPGAALLTLSPDGDTQLVVQIDEKNLRRVALGQPAQASADAYADERFAAEVAYISPGVDAQRGSVEVKLAVPRPPAYLRQDMTVSVDMQVARRASAVLVPADAVHDADGPRPWVLRVEGARARRRDVRIGLRGGAWSEVLDGLAAGDRVVPVAAAQVRDGQRLRLLPAPPGAP